MLMVNSGCHRINYETINGVWMILPIAASRLTVRLVRKHCD